MDITRRDAVLLLDKVRERAPVGANRLQGVMVRMFNFAAERGIVDHSPLVGMRRAPEKPRSRVLSDKEIKLFWAATNIENTAVDVYRLSKLALRLILLTGQRPGEVSGLAWEEIDEAAKVWTIPSERRKGRIEHRVPLCHMALETIQAAQVYSEDSPFVFRSSHKRKQPLGRLTLSNAIRRHWGEIGFKEAFTPHDLRRTLRTRLAELGIEDVVAERVLGHKLQGLLAVYNLHSYDKEKRQALTAWESRLRGILGLEPKADGKIIPFEVRKNA